jgi:hypothetical protein
MEQDKGFFNKKARQIFLSAIELPLHARPEYYAKKQIESGWGKYVFFETMRGYYQMYSFIINKEKERIEGLKQEVTFDETHVYLEKDLKDVRPSRMISGKELEELREAIEAAGKWLDPKPNYTPMQIISFIESSLRFIKSQFKYQTEVRLAPYIINDKGVKVFDEDEFDKIFNSKIVFNENTHQDYKLEGDGDIFKVTTRYIIKDSLPAFDFNRFKLEVRNLLLTTPNEKNLQRILAPFYEIALECVNLWNDKGDLLNGGEPEKDKRHEGTKYNGVSVIKERDRWIFKTENPGFNFSREDLGKSVWHNVQKYTNYDFAVFCEKVATLLGTEVLNNEKTVPHVKVTVSDIKAPTIRLFCSIIHQSGIIIKGDEESVESYCKSVCEKYEFQYTQNIRKHFTVSMDIKSHDKHLVAIQASIIPKLPTEEKNKIELFINSKTKTFA